MDIKSYDSQEPFQLERLGFVREGVEELKIGSVAALYCRGDMFITLSRGKMIVQSFYCVRENGHGILYAGDYPTCHHHGEILFDLISERRAKFG